MVDQTTVVQVREAARGRAISDGDKGDISIAGGVWSINEDVISPFGRTLTDDADAVTARQTLGVRIGEDVQGYSDNLTALDFASTAFGRGFLGLADPAAGRAVLELGTAAVAAIDTDVNLAADADDRVPSQKAAKSYVNAQIAAAVTGLLDFKGNLDASTNPNYPAGSVGDAYVISAAGTVGGVAGKNVDVGDVIVVSADNAGGTEAAVGASWFVLEHNLAGVLQAANNLSDIGDAAAARANLGLGTAAVQPVGAFVVTALGRVALSQLTAVDVARLHENYRGGLFRWVALNLSAQVALDTTQAIYIPPHASTGLATDGSAGAWVRQNFHGICPGFCGALFDGATDDTDAWQAAVTLASALGINRVQSTQIGISKLVAKAASTGTHGGDAYNVYRAVNINYSNLTLDLGNCTIQLVSYGGDGAGAHYAFGTDKNMVLGTLQNLKVCNGTIDFIPLGGDAGTRRGVYIVGCDGIEFDNLFFTSSGARKGSAWTVHNSQNLTLNRLRNKNILQGGYIAYVDDIIGDDLQFDTFTEALDFNHLCRRGVLTNLKFKNALDSDYQCLDLNSCEDFFVNGVEVYNVGVIAYMNYKYTDALTYADWVNGVGNGGVYKPSKRITIQGVHGDTVGTGGKNPFYLGNDQADISQSAYPNERLTLRDIKLTNAAGYIMVELSQNFLIEDVYINGLGVASTIGAIDIRADFAGYTPTGTIRNTHLKLAAIAQRGVYMTKAGKIVLDNVTVEGNGTANCRFFDAANMDANNMQLTVERCTALLNGDTTATAWGFNDNSAGTPAINWGDGNRIIGAFTNPFIMGGTAAKRVQKKCRASFGSLAITTGVTRNLPIFATDKESAYVSYVTVKSAVAIAANATNFVSYNVRSNIAGADTSSASGSDTAGFAAAAAWELASGAYAAGRMLGDDDLLYVRFVASGSGRTYDGIVVTAHYLDFATS